MAERLAKGICFIVAAALALLLVRYMGIVFGFDATLIIVDIIVILVTVFLFAMGAKQRRAATSKPPVCPGSRKKENVSIDYFNFFMPFDDLKAKYKKSKEAILIKREELKGTELQNRRVIMMCVLLVGIANIVYFLYINGNPVKYFVDAIMIYKFSPFEILYHAIQPFTLAAILFYEYSGCKRWLYDHLNGTGEKLVSQRAETETN